MCIRNRVSNFVRVFLTAGVLGCAISGPAQSQVSAMGALNDVNPWGVGWISPRKGGLPTSLWSDTRSDDIEALLDTIDLNNLTPAQTDLLKIVLMSGGVAPQDGGETLIWRRLRLLDELGEGDKVLELVRRFPDAGWSRDAAQLEADMDLVSGDNRRACARIETEPEDDVYWQRLRATCLAIAGNHDAALLALELAQSNGLEDPWLFSAIEKMGSESGAKLPGRYDTGVTTAISLASDLRPPLNAMSNVAPDRAAILARRDDIPPALREQAALRAAYAGVLSEADERKALAPAPAAPAAEDKIADDSANQSESSGGNSVIQRAIAAVENPKLDLAQKTRAILSPIRQSEEDPRAYALTARVLLPELRSIPQTRETARMAPYLVRAAIAAGDLKLARTWRASMDNPYDTPPEEDAPPAPVQTPPPVSDTSADPATPRGVTITPLPEPPPKLPPISFANWTKAQLDAMLLLMSPTPSPRDEVDIIDALTQTAQTSNAEEAIHLLHILSALGAPLPAKTREMVASHYSATAPKPELAGDIARMRMAMNAGAMGEGALRALLIINQQGSTPANAAALEDVLLQLQIHGMTQTARALALEAAGPWRMR